jgi:hypothetical protein
VSSPDPIRSIIELIGSRVGGRGGGPPTLSPMRAVPPRQNLGDAVLGPFGLSGPNILDMQAPRTPQPQLAQQMMERLGYLPELRSGNYNYDESLALYNAVSPWGEDYHEGQSPLDRIKIAQRRVTDYLQNPQQRRIDAPEESKAQEDAYALWLGLPQPFGSFDVSPYKPSRSLDKNKTYLRLPSLWPAIAYSRMGADPLAVGLSHGDQWYREGVRKASEMVMDEEGVRNILNYLGDSDKKLVSGDDLVWSELKPGVALANFTIGKGQDDRGHYISYYDIWDLGVPGAGSRIGRDFEIYDRLYYDPKTFRPINPPRPSRVRGRGHPGMPRRR